jgi:predicted RNA binding protein YcfA (HicA-like mRNA interferase family)
MPKLRQLSGAEVAYIFEQFGFAVHAQRGSHIKLQRTGSSGEKQTLTIPNHRELDTGNLAGHYPSGRPIRS